LAGAGSGAVAADVALLDRAAFFGGALEDVA